jgi:hypothetical protein
MSSFGIDGSAAVFAAIAAFFVFVLLVGKISIQRRVPCGSVRKFTYLRISS